MSIKRQIKKLKERESFLTNAIVGIIDTDIREATRLMVLRDKAYIERTKAEDEMWRNYA